MHINNIMRFYGPVPALVLALMLVSCGKSEEEISAEEQARLDSLNSIDNVRMVAAIAKVEPAEGFVELSTEISGIVVELLKHEGDSVSEGELILRLDAEEEDLQLTTARQDIQTQQSRVAAAEADVHQYEASLKEKEEDLAITSRLATTGADTRQNVAIKQKERDVIQANLDAAKAQLEVGRRELVSLKTQLAQSELSSGRRSVTAKASGVLVSLDAKVGTGISAFTPFATLAPEDGLVLHGEIDERFASLVKVGQSLQVNYVGSQQVIAEGQVTYLSPILDNKSLFYEKSGETSDRRVRLFKATFTAQEPLLINARVECKIKIQ